MRRPLATVTGAALAVAIVFTLSGCSVVSRAASCKSNSGATPTATAELTAAEKVALPEDQFWSLIDELKGSNSDAAYERLTLKLATLPQDQILGFEARMTIALYSLDDQCRSNWYKRHDPSGLGVLGLSADDFLYVRANTVSAGRANWDKAIKTDTLPWGSADPLNGDGESLLYVAGDAAKRALGISLEDWYDLVYNACELSYETASNPDGWPHNVGESEST